MCLFKHSLHSYKNHFTILKSLVHILKLRNDILVISKSLRKQIYDCRNLLFLLFDSRYRFEPSHLFSCSYVTALREFPAYNFLQHTSLQIMQIVCFCLL